MYMYGLSCVWQVFVVMIWWMNLIGHVHVHVHVPLNHIISGAPWAGGVPDQSLPMRTNKLKTAGLSGPTVM